MYEVETLLNRLHAIESAVPDNVREIRERHVQRQAQVNRLGQCATIDQAHTDRATLLAIVQRQGLEASQHRAEIAEIAKSLDCSRAEVARQAGDIAKMAELVDEVGKESVADVAEAMRQRDAARAEVERLKVALKNHTPELRAALAREETAHLATLAELDEVRAEWAAEVERLKTANQALAAENARLVNEVGDADQKLAQIRERVRRWEDQEDGATDNMEDIARIVRDLL